MHEFSMEDKDAGAAENLTLWQNLDMLLENIKDLPEHVDDVVLSMYPPIDIINIGKIVRELNPVRLLLFFIRFLVKNAFLNIVGCNLLVLMIGCYN